MILSRIILNPVRRAQGASLVVTPFLTVLALAVSLVSTTWFVPGITPHIAAESQLPASVAPSGSNRNPLASRGAPMIFVENVGQFDERIHFQARSGHTTLFLTNDALWVSLTEPSSRPDPISAIETPDAVGTETRAGRGINLRLSFVGANAHPRLEPFNKLDTQISFFTGSDPDEWHTHVPAWGGVRYVDLYPGVDLEITSQNGQLAQQLVAREDSSLQNVRLRVEGADDLALEGNTLHLATSLGDFALPLVTVEGARPNGQPSVFRAERGTFQVSSPFASAPMSADVSARALPPSLRDGLLVYYSFDSDEGGIVTDESGFGNDGTVVGTPTYTTQGKFGGAYYFAAASGSECCSWYRDYVVLNGNPTADLEQFAVSLWFKTDHPEFNYKIASAADWPPGSGWVVGTHYPEAWSDDGNSIRYGSRTRSVDPIAGTWNHVVVSYDGTTFKEHINGQLSREWPTTGLPLGDANGQSLAVAAWPQHGFGYDGLIDEFRIYRRALSADEVSMLYDPGWSYSTYLGGNGDDIADDITVDTTDNVYITGQTSSVNFPTTPGAYDTSYSGDPTDVFVTKVSADGSTLLYSTYLGGNGVDAGNGIAVDSAGNVYITGATYSTDFPATPGALDTTLNGGRDAFVVKLNATGDVLIYGTYLGGSSWEYGLDIAADDAGDAYVTGFTHGGFPTTPGVVQHIHSGSCDAFVTKLNADGSALVYSTYLGGSSLDHGENIALDGEGNAYVTGDAYSIDFPTANPLQPTKAGGGDAFVTKLNADGSALVFSTYLGGSGTDRDIGRDITVDSAGSVYVTGSTDSPDFPTVSPLQPTYSGGASDAFVAKLNASGGALVYSTYLGGSGTDERTGIAIDSIGNAYVTGVTTSTDFPTANPQQATNGGGSDAFVAKLHTDGSALLYSSYLGGSGDENPLSPSTIGGIAVDSGGNIFLAGTTGSLDFPTTPGAYDTSYNGGNYDVFVTRLGPGEPPPLLFYSTYLGGSGEDRAYDFALDRAGNVCITGQTSSADFPTTPGAYDRFYGGDPIDVFVSKLSVDGGTLMYSTYLGGSSEDAGNGISVDSVGNVYITGKTYSTDFPATSGALDTALSGGRDAFVAKLNAAGDDLIYSTYLGGSSWDYGSCIAIDDTGNAYVGGFTHGSFPVTSGAAQTTFGGSGDGFATKLSPDGGTLLYSTYLGGYSWEGIAGIAVDEAGNAYLASHTHSTDFPTTPGAWDRSCDNCQPNISTDGAVAKLNADGSQFVYSTLVGGADASGEEEFRDIAIDSAGNAYLTGSTSSIDFPTTANAVQPGFAGGGYDTVVVKLNAAGSDLLYSTYLGGSGADRAYGIAIDGSGSAYVTGYTASTDFATVDPLQAANAGGYDAFVTKVNDDASALLYSSYLGGSGDENCHDPPQGYGRIALQGTGNICVTGFTDSHDFPVTVNGYDVSFNGGPYDTFVTSLDLVPVQKERVFLPLILKP